jgi:hypothetical protein
MSQLVPKALVALDALGREDGEVLLSWLVAARGDDTLPRRIDLLLDEAPGSLLDRAKEWRQGMDG